ncbi:MAG: hypothetical protein IKO49_04195 [Bacilli bacterium]|nr:hypothetical protein [Bacilli bacterium]
MLYYQKKKNLFLNNTILYFSLLFVLISIIIITSMLHVYININILKITNIVLLIVSIISFIYILKIKDYKTIYKRVTNINSYTLNDGSSISKEEIYSINNEYKKKVNRYKYKSPYKYFNSIFIKRHKNILLKPILRETIFLLVIGIITVIGVLINKRINDIVSFTIMKYFMWLFLIIYILNKTQPITEAMFINCDRSLLTYDFYKEKKVIINIFKERLVSLIIINLLPVIILSTFIPLLLHITVGINIYNMILVFITLTTTSILFTIHSLSLYYLMEPYDKDSRLTDLRYQIINSLLIIILLILVKIKISLNVLTIITISISILYIIISIILVNTKAQKTFKLK